MRTGRDLVHLPAGVRITICSASPGRKLGRRGRPLRLPRGGSPLRRHRGLLLNRALLPRLRGLLPGVRLLAPALRLARPRRFVRREVLIVELNTQSPAAGAGDSLLDQLRVQPPIKIASKSWFAASAESGWKVMLPGWQVPPENRG